MPKTIFWIDDDTNIIDPLVKPLEAVGYDFRRFNTITEALDNIDSFLHASLILLDIIIPPGETESEVKLGGYQYPGIYILRKLIDFGINVPVVILSVMSNDKITDALDANKLLVTKILRKPIRPSILKKEIEAILK